MNKMKKPDLRFRLFSWLGRIFYRFRMELEEWQFWIDGIASRYDPDEN
ncbi:hypothetical protein [Flavilitoribacter nigricans]|nr:hypothetical protein [Flavilitoribacter nigricans]